MRERIKILLGIENDEKNILIDNLIKLAQDEIREFCNTEDISTFESTIIQMVMFKYNRLGTEGVTAESYSGASFSYAEDYPESIMRVLKRNRRIRVL